MKQLTFRLTTLYMARYIFMLCILALTVVYVNGQTTDSLNKPVNGFKNSIKLNISNIIIYDKAIQLSYERVIKKNQTLNISAGYQEFPGNVVLDLDKTELGDTKKKSGYTFGLDYRFYLSKENKYKAPHGVYLAPFISFQHFNADRTLTHIDSIGTKSSANINTRIYFINIGCELGYQFVLGKRWVIDAVVFGPAITNYNFKAKLDNNIPGLDENAAAQAIIEALKEKLPLLNDLTSEHGVNRSGIEEFWSVGFRYSINFGYRF